MRGLAQSLKNLREFRREFFRENFPINSEADLWDRYFALVMDVERALAALASGPADATARAARLARMALERA